MRDGFLIVLLCIVAFVIGGWLYFYAPPSISVFPHGMYQPIAYAPSHGAGQAAAAEVAFSEIASGTQAQVTDQKNYAIRAADALVAIWNQVTKASPPPKVDFNKNDVIAVFAGQKPTGGYSIKIEKITDMNGQLVVSIVLTQPGSDCAVTESLTSPFDIVQVPASALTPVREERVETQDCP